MRRIARLGALVAVVSIGSGVALNALVIGTTGAAIKSAGDGVRRMPVALVLGALTHGPEAHDLSPVLEDRVVTAAELYLAGKVDKVLASGDHGRRDYDEVTPMRKRLLALGVAPEDVFCDHAGFDTWSSVVRARKVFEASEVVVVTQRFHLPRALYLAERAGLDATGIAADRRDYGRRVDQAAAREWLARPKAVVEAALDRPPPFLGATMAIATADGRSTWGEETWSP